MSDFDEEAERERLREKYERDQRKRQATERMSDLLLKGATMTNAHCGECGDPIFRHDGQEFCPSCETVVGQVEADDAEGDSEETAGTADATEAPSASTAAEASEAATTSEADERSTDAGSERADVTFDDATTADRTPPDRSQRVGDVAPETMGVEDSTTGADESQVETEPSPSYRTDTPTSSASTDAPADLAAARASLTRTVTRLARRAEASDDLGRTRELLAATEEAAAALAAVEDADR